MNNRALFVIVFGLSTAAAQDTSRRIWDDYFANARPAPQAPKQASSPQYTSGYRPANPPEKKAIARKEKPLEEPKMSSALGVTVWRLEPSTEADEARLLVQEDRSKEHSVQLTPHRLEANQPLKEGDRVRLSIESPRAGFLYVIDQEKLADGTLGDPYLIFPTTRARGGSNSVHPGQLLDVPGQTDVPNVFTLKPRSADEVGEKVTLILSPTSISGLTITKHEQKISPELFDVWKKQWDAGSQQFELSGGEGRAWTSREKQAGEDRSRLLTQEDPPPQTIFVFPRQAGKPIIASLDLQLKK